MSRSRRKLDTSPIEYEDVVDSPALKGMVSFLEIPPGELPKLDFTEPTPKRGTPAAGSPESPVPVTDPAALQPSGAPPAAAPISEVPVSAAPPIAAAPAASLSPAPPLPSYPPVNARPATRVRRAASAQDGHSFGEQALYDALWQHAHPYAAETRIITIGYRRMAELARLTVNNCKANIQSLIQKLAVEEVASFTHSQGRTYLVYSDAAITQRRREAGLTHYIKSRGVVFVDPDTAEPLTARIRDRSGAPFSALPDSGAAQKG